MIKTMYEDANKIIETAIRENLPNAAVEKALKEHKLSGSIYLLAIGKAAWSMAKAATDCLGDTIKKGIIITKYGHSGGAIPSVEIIEAGHPLSDHNTILGTQKAIDLANSLTGQDELLFLISGGGSALFEKPLPGLSLANIVDINNQLLASGADIVEINTIRKRLSCVKAGRFAEMCYPARILAVVLSDVLGNRLDAIASGPASPDQSTTADAMAIVRKFNLNITNAMKEYLLRETPKQIQNVDAVITGSVRSLCDSTANAARSLGYTPVVLSSTINCEASEAGKTIASIANEIRSISKYSPKPPCAIIMGGETVVHLKSGGTGGRNQELALTAAMYIQDLENVVVFSYGSDGTDGPTDAAGGIVDGQTAYKLAAKGLSIQKILADNDSYNGLKAADGLLFTGPTGTNVNDVSVLLCR